MTSKLAEPHQYDPVDPGLADLDGTAPYTTERFWGVMRNLQASCPVSHSDAHGGFWTVTGNDAVLEVARDWPSFTTSQGVAVVPFDVGDTEFVLLPFESDPPFQQSLRKLVNSHFLPKAVAQHEEAMRRVANALIDAFIENGRCEFMEEFAAQYPARVFFEEILGLPADQISGSFDAVQRIVMNPGSTLEPLMVLMPWCQEVLTARRDEQRRDDVLDALVHGMVNGERPLTLTEQVQMLITLLIGGFETTSSAIGSAVLHLATDMKLQHALSATGADIETACEEFLRFEAPVPAIARTATRDTELTGCPIKKGERVLIYYGAANRDPAAWHDPDRLDIARENAKRHVTFGKGIHVCLGANLARLELRVALTTIVQRLTKIELDPSPEKSLSWRNGQTRGPLHLPITFRPKS